jgi:hypothetical protein
MEGIASGVITTQSYTDDATFAMEEDADLHEITMGQQVIDGKAVGVVVMSAEVRQSAILKEGHSRSW